MPAVSCRNVCFVPAVSRSVLSWLFHVANFVPSQLFHAVNFFRGSCFFVPVVLSRELCSALALSHDYFVPLQLLDGVILFSVPSVSRHEIPPRISH